MSVSSAESCAAFSRSAEIYDLVHSGKGYDSEARRVLELLGNPASGMLIDWGAGTGEFTKRFSAQMEAIGIEYSMEMARLAQAKGIDVRPGDMADALDEDIPPANAQTCLFAAFSYAAASHPPLLILENFRNIAVKGSKLVFDFVNADAEVRPIQVRDVVDDSKKRRVRVRQYKRLVDMRLIENSIDYMVRCQRVADWSEWSELHYLRTFTAREMAELLARAGWSLEKFVDLERGGVAPLQGSYYLTAVCTAQ